MKVDRIIIGINDNPEYYSILPVCYAAWQKFFPEAKVTLAVVNGDDKLDLIYKFMHHCNDMTGLSFIKGVPSANLAKVARFFVASKYPDEVCMINDIDLIPLQRQYYFNNLQQRKENELLCIGGDVYKRTPHFGKFPMGYITGEGELFKHIFNPFKDDWEIFISSLSLFHGVFDEKENIKKPFKKFSDESLIRALLKDKDIAICKQNLNFKIHEDSVTRKMQIDEKKLFAGGYVEAHHLLPVEKHIDKINLICKYLDFNFNPDWHK